MLRLHQYLEEVRLKNVMDSVYTIQAGIDKVSQLVPQNLTHFKFRKR